MDFDIDALRTFVAVVDGGGFAAAARRVNRSRSAVSVRIQRLEGQVGARLFKRAGRRKVLTEDGEELLRYARAIVSLNDEARQALGRTGLEGPVRLGAIPDLTEELTPLLAEFARRHPASRLEVHIANSSGLAGRLERAELDLALTADAAHPDAVRLRREPIVWIGPVSVGTVLPDPIPLVVCESPCGIRDRAIRALESASRAWRIVFVSPSLAGIRAAVRAGLGITARGTGLLGPGVREIDPGAGLPDLPPLDIALRESGQKLSPAAEGLAEILRSSVAARPRAGWQSARQSHTDC